ncbi:hypothetical protein WA026_018414 [Henosepilachna vigintioctopunctata]|uniref:tRNA-specific adenosine deaminase 1 n=1 Tax=Henosepilachna vigintioctopunctata TaxID=420089 RepID=A0AAW1V1Z4_9CUCU
MNCDNKIEKIARFSFDTFDSLQKTGKPKINEWTVLSCIIQEEDSHFKTVALGTGSKCIGKNKMSNKGDILNDSHAEVICRRAFLLYLYEQMENTLEDTNTIFVFDSNLMKYNLKPNIKFHFFTTLMPCGDANIFPKNEENNFNVGDLILDKERELNSSGKRPLDGGALMNIKRQKCINGDIFRTGAKCLDCDEIQDVREAGVGYHVTGVVRTKPGRGDPTLSVSCSDKLAKWCHLGLQGALISILLKEPIYLSSFNVTCNTPYSEESLQRAFFDRLKHVGMIFPYKKSHLIFKQATQSVFSFQKNEQKEVCPSSIIWFKSEKLNQKHVEVAVGGRKQGITKKNQNFPSSRLQVCKLELFKRFLALYGNFSDKFSKLTYRQCKEEAVTYQKNWNILKKELRVWPKKERNLLEFSLND